MRLLIYKLNFFILMLQLNLKFKNSQGDFVPELCIDGVVPQQINAVMSFMNAGSSFTVECVDHKVDISKD